MSLKTYYIDSNDETNISVEADKHTEDSQLKYKSRTINLIKQNPNLFVNRSRSKFTEIYGGSPALIATLGFGLLGLAYRVRVNSLRQVGLKEGYWFNFSYFCFGLVGGVVYSSVYFLKWQMLMNDYFANFLLKRYPGSVGISRSNIYRLKDVENNDEEYRFTQKFLNNFHM